jgi:hypothetical protein
MSKNINKSLKEGILLPFQKPNLLHGTGISISLPHLSSPTYTGIINAYSQTVSQGNAAWI